MESRDGVAVNEIESALGTQEKSNNSRGDEHKENVAENLELAQNDANLVGWNNMFCIGDEEEDYEVDSEDGSSERNNRNAEKRLSQLEEHTIQIRNFRIRMLQASSAFMGSGQDDTGCVLWGAAYHLAEWLCDHTEVVHGKKAIELGCGAGIPSLIACKLGAAYVVATDSEKAPLAQVERHAELNQCNSPTTCSGEDQCIESQTLDWEDPFKKWSEPFDLIMASDVIYGVAKVPALVQTIDELCSKDNSSLVIVAARDGRRGVAEFVEAMKYAFFVQIDTIHYPFNKGAPVPQCFRLEDSSLARWEGNHTLYTFRRAVGSTAT